MKVRGAQFGLVSRAHEAAREFLERLTAFRRIAVLPITPDIAALAYSATFPHGDPADRLIAATAMVHGAPLITEDRLLHGIEGLTTVW